MASRPTSITLGALVLLMASGLFGGIVADIVTNGTLTELDLRVAAWLHVQAIPSLITVMRGISALGSRLVVLPLALLTTLLLGWWRHWYALLTVVVAVPGGVLLPVLLKPIFHRPRPTFGEPPLTLTTYSFPSSHAMAATVLYGVLAALAIRSIRGWRWRFVVALFASLLIVLVALSRLYLGVHYLSDVLGGITAGIAWLAFCLTAVHTIRRCRLG